jgi:hypothetical protein
MENTSHRRRPGFINWFFTDAKTGRAVLWQTPNVPLAVFLLTAVVRLLVHPGGTVGAALLVVGTLALVVWASLEILRGDSPFRRVLGTAVLAFQFLSLLRH